MAFSLPDLPYALDALAPHISRETLELHHGTHHAGYVETLNDLVSGSPIENEDLLSVVRAAEGESNRMDVYNNAAQAWNHEFFWESMRPGGGGEPGGAMLERIKSDFGGYETFRDRFIDTASGQFGSGWAWLVLSDGMLDIASTANAGVPISDGRVPLLTCDVWEHAYYLDYQSGRGAFVERFVDNLIDWDRVQSRLESA